jgi:K+-sensing histidine kinase KdpD
MGSNTRLDTFFDSPEKSSNEEVLNEIFTFKQNSLINQLLEGYPELAVILNEHRQIVAFNTQALKVFNAGSHLDIVGKRVGEAIYCIHSDEMEGGCGTSKFCKECGAAQAIKKTKDLNIPAQNECRITIRNNNKEHSLDLSVHTHLIKISEKQYTLFAIKDISHEKRRDALERIFFHDVLNTASAVRGLSELFSEIDDENQRNEMAGLIMQSSDQLVKEIEAQRELRRAEDGNLSVNLQLTSVNKILTNVFGTFKNHELTEGLKQKLVLLEPDFNFSVDDHLLIRSLNNLYKNALEASDTGLEVEILAKVLPGEIHFNVSNQTVIPEQVQLQLFQRSFSTKEQKGRGVGLYSVKLIVEQYLSGKVLFVSNNKARTIFSIVLPTS